MVAFEETNDAVVSERSNFRENQDYKSYFCVAVNQYVPIFWGQMRVVAKTNNTHTYTHSHTHTHAHTHIGKLL